MMNLNTIISAALISGIAVSESANCPKGWLLWHSYTSYKNDDSSLFYRTPDGKISEINGDFIHAMNGDFGCSPFDIVFMAKDPKHDEWDIFRYDAITDTVENLTEISGFRNEDPKFSPDGKSVVFKRGEWSNITNDFVFNLALLDLESRNVTMITDSVEEKSMPFFSTDGKVIYYSERCDDFSTIMCYDVEKSVSSVIYKEDRVDAYYPVICGNKLYFTKWVSANNCNDNIICFDGHEFSSMPFNSDCFDCSDPCGIDGERMIYSSTQNGTYDLFYFNGEKSFPLEFAHSDKNELGASFFSYTDYCDYLNNMQDFILGKESEQFNYDINNDGIADSIDLAIAKSTK